MTSFELKFSPQAVKESGTYKLIQLAPDLCALVESSLNNSDPLCSLSVRGQANEDAVLCTRDKTFALRSVVLSNSLLIVTANDTASTLVDIRDQVGDVLEPVPCVPRLHKLQTLLKGRVYDEGHATGADNVGQDESRHTYDQAREMIQASDGELDRALKDRRILIINGELQPISPSYLRQVLELLLNVLVSLSLSHDAAPVNELALILANDHEVEQTVTKQIMSWFGRITGDMWEMDVRAIVKEIGLNILSAHSREPIEQESLLAKWKAAVGDSFESAVSLDLLSGNHIVSDALGTVPESQMLTYFPASVLSVDPAARFAELFLVRPRWKEEEISPFLVEIALDAKERDKLLLKYCRAITEAGTVWYTARTQYNG
ncbi:hypothetical protein AX17_001265 [Amanita inopinata Kibby_2008]|nr:hypothetical protein AX17_001265 [Amanita inopinata Kibby_2008]